MFAEGRCKGSVLIHLRAYVEQHRGAPVWKELVEAQEADERAVLEGLIIAGGWYSVVVWNRALGWLLPRHAAGSPDEEMRRVASYIADKDLSTVYKMVLRLGSPEFLLRRTDSLWSRYFDVGKMTNEELGPRRWKLLLDTPRGDKVPDRFTCGPGVCAWIEMGLRNTGVQGRVQHVECRLGNAPRCEYHVTW